MEVKDFINKLLEENWYVTEWVGAWEFEMHSDGVPLTTRIALWSNDRSEVIVYNGNPSNGDVVTRTEIRNVKVTESGRLVYPKTFECGIFEKVWDNR